MYPARLTRAAQSVLYILLHSAECGAEAERGTLNVVGARRDEISGLPQPRKRKSMFVILCVILLLKCRQIWLTSAYAVRKSVGVQNQN